MRITKESQIRLHPLSIQKDKKNYIVEEPISGNFFEMPKICIDAIDLLEQDKTVASVEQIVKENYPDEKVDMVDFVGQLVELGLVQEVDGIPVDTEKEKQGSEVRGFTWIPSEVGRFFFNPMMNKVYFLLFLANILIVVMNHDLFPHYQDIFLFDSMMMNMLVYLFISLVLIVIHEFGHVLAIRAHDLPAKLSIGNRLILIVFETDLTSAWKLPSKERNVLYLGGMALEQIIVFVALISMILFPEAAFSGILAIVVFDIFIKTLYQCCFYMKTDMYYVVENVTGCYNLMESGLQYLRETFLKRAARKKVTELFTDELPVVRLYSLFYVGGVLLTFSLFFIYFIPQLYYAYTTVISNMLDPKGTMDYWDGIFFLGQTLLLAGILVYLAVKRRNHRRAGL